MTYFVSEVTLTVLSKRTLDEMDVGDIMRECDEGDMVLASVRLSAYEVDRTEMDQALTAAGSDPEFFPMEDDSL